MYWSPQLLGRSFQKARNFTASGHQTAGFSIWVFKNFPGVIPLEPHSGRGRPPPVPNTQPGLCRAGCWVREGFACVVSKLWQAKPWSPSTLHPWLRPCRHSYFWRVKFEHFSWKMQTSIGQRSFEFYRLSTVWKSLWSALCDSGLSIERVREAAKNLSFRTAIQHNDPAQLWRCGDSVIHDFLIYLLI